MILIGCILAIFGPSSAAPVFSHLSNATLAALINPREAAFGLVLGATAAAIIVAAALQTWHLLLARQRGRRRPWGRLERFLRIPFLASIRFRHLSSLPLWCRRQPMADLAGSAEPPRSLSGCDSLQSGAGSRLSILTIVVLSSLLAGMSMNQVISRETRSLTAVSAVLGFVFCGHRRWPVSFEGQASCANTAERSRGG